MGGIVSRLAPLVALLAVGCVPRLYTGAGGEPWSWEAPENSWHQSAPPEGTTGTGYAPGQVVPDFRLLDQFGDQVSLWQFYGQVILLDISTMWCAPCQELAQHTEETWQDYIDEDFIYLTVLQEDVEGEPPELDDLEIWAETFGITSPVLADGEKEGTGTAVIQGQFPAVLVIDRELVVTDRINPPEDEVVRAAIDAAL